MFIVFEGIDGTGKTTIVKRLAKDLTNSGYDVFITQEPTKTWIGRDVRRAIEEEKNGFTQALLFFADRADHLEELRRNMDKVILCDRYVYSTFAYQGAQLEKIMGFENALKWFQSVYEPMRLDPDMVFLIKVNPEEGIRRIYGREKKEKFERVEFLKRVQEIYERIASLYGFIIVDGNRGIEEIYEDIRSEIMEKLKST